MASDWDLLTGEAPEPRSHRRTLNRQPSSKSLKTSSGRPAKHQQVLVNENSQKPSDVTDEVWGVVQQWWDLGVGALGSNPRVKRSEFSRTLRDRIQQDPDVRKMIKTKGIDAARPEITRILARMSEIFWDRIESGDTSLSVQSKYWDEWDQLWYDAVTSIEIHDLNRALRDGRARLIERNYKMFVPNEARAVQRKAKTVRKTEPDIDYDLRDQKIAQAPERIKQIREAIAKRRAQRNSASLSD